MYYILFSPELGIVGVGRVCDPIDTGGGASAPVGARDPPAAASQHKGNACNCWLGYLIEGKDTKGINVSMCVGNNTDAYVGILTRCSWKRTTTHLIFSLGRL